MSTPTITTQLYTILTKELDANESMTLAVHQWKDLLELNALKVENRFLNSAINDQSQIFSFDLLVLPFFLTSVLGVIYFINRYMNQLEQRELSSQ